MRSILPVVTVVNRVGDEAFDCVPIINGMVPGTELGGLYYNADEGMVYGIIPQVGRCVLNYGPRDYRWWCAFWLIVWSCVAAESIRNWEWAEI